MLLLKKNLEEEEEVAMVDNEGKAKGRGYNDGNGYDDDGTGFTQRDRVHTSEQRSFKNKSTADLTDSDSEKRVGRSDKLLVTVCGGGRQSGEREIKTFR